MAKNEYTSIDGVNRPCKKPGCNGQIGPYEEPDDTGIQKKKLRCMICDLKYPSYPFKPKDPNTLTEGEVEFIRSLVDCLPTETARKKRGSISLIGKSLGINYHIIHEGYYGKKGSVELIAPAQYSENGKTTIEQISSFIEGWEVVTTLQVVKTVYRKVDNESKM